MKAKLKNKDGKVKQILKRTRDEEHHLHRSKLQVKELIDEAKDTLNEEEILGEETLVKIDGK